MSRKTNVGIFRESTLEWQWMNNVSMSDAVRLTSGVRAFIVTDPTGYCLGANGDLLGDLKGDYQKTQRALKHSQKKKKQWDDL